LVSQDSSENKAEKCETPPIETRIILTKQLFVKGYNEERVHSGKYCIGKTPMQTFLDSIPLVKEKMLNNNLQTETVAVSD
jgi:hypothetical protein